jgi:hypothetical protein
MVQGHVDKQEPHVAKKLVEAGFYTFEYDEALNITIEKVQLP